MAAMFKSPPKPPKPQLSPDKDAILAAKKKSLAIQQKRSGRASTLLSDQSERLGG